MFHLTAFSAIALSLVVSVSSLVVPRATPPPGWNTELLENYDTYHARYMALSCETKHSSAFFTQCCHPLLATQTLATARPAQCIPATSTTALVPASTAPASTATDDGDDDDDLPFCDDDGDDNDDSTTPAAPAATTAAPAAVITTHPAAVTTPAPAPKQVTTTSAKPVATPSSNSPTSSVNTGGVATFFYQNGQFGACGQKHQDTDFIAAIDGARYGNLGAVSSLCGKQVKITNTQNQKTVTVTIEDACPTCDNSNSIDLSVGAFEAISDLNTGEVPISWVFL